MKKRMAMAVWLGLAGLAMAAVNEVQNGGFESVPGPADWAVTWGGFGVEDWNSPPEGARAGFLKGTWAGSGNMGGLIQRVAAEPRAFYELSALFYIDQGWTAESRLMKIEFFDEADNLLAAREDKLVLLDEGKWVRKSIAAQAPDGTAAVQVVIEANGVGDSGVLGVDDIVLAKEKVVGAVRAQAR